MKRYLVLLVAMISTIVICATFSFPVSTTPLLTSSFGEFRGTGNRGPHFHMGIDLSTGMRSGVPILAAEDGWLVRVEIDEDDIYGNVVVLYHDDGYKTLYAHLSEFSEKLKLIIDSVVSEFGRKRIVVKFPERTFFFKAGEPVGYSGQTGEAAQPHCHFEIRNIDETICYDPSQFLNILKPKEARFIVKSLVINSEKYSYREDEAYPFKGDFPKISINAVTEINKNVIGLKSLKMYLNENLVYHIDFSEIPIDEFNNVWSVYTNDSVADGYNYDAWYKLYPDQWGNVIKVDNYAEIGKLPSKILVRIICTDFWNEEFEVRFFLERR